MARKKLSEYKAKSLLLQALDIPYAGIEVVLPDLSPLKKLDPQKKYVVKVDQATKKRFKLGLVALNISQHEIQKVIGGFEQKGYSRFIIEPFTPHAAMDEAYLAIQRTREGFVLSVSAQGGVTIEEHPESLQSFSQGEIKKAAIVLHAPANFLEGILEVMQGLHISFLEVNPLVVEGKEIFFLDLAVEVDSAGEFFVKNGWTDKDFVDSVKRNTPEEEAVEELSKKSQASFRLVVLNPHGSIFMLLSGGGASIVLADEVYNQGKGRELANYGEYSGNPNAEETYLYTKQLLSLLRSSSSQKKVLIIAGGVANFTDIRVTFAGIIQALREVREQLRTQGVKVFVRRGGPFQDEGLATLKEFLTHENLLGSLAGPELILTEIVSQAIKELKS